ncbi:unnamed protein product [Schistosoma mattheei]|uniref:Uncharacterized protein n=1 Tax=Schistosoma mattheei TaxID=31246 RepID=A0A183NXB7_9TREM|nr:unnamed protein product [Schistosoma mattheei]
MTNMTKYIFFSQYTKRTPRSGEKHRNEHIEIQFKTDSVYTYTV